MFLRCGLPLLVGFETRLRMLAKKFWSSSDWEFNFHVLPTI